MGSVSCGRKLQAREPESNRPSSEALAVPEAKHLVLDRVFHVAGRGAFDIEALGEEAAVALTRPAEPADPPLTSEAQLFDLSPGMLKDVKIERQKRGAGAKPGDTELVPYFWTKGSAKHPSKPSANTVKLFDELAKATSQPLWRVLVALSIRHVGPTAARSLG